jgi:DegV family protein with EDD domain
MVGKMVKVITDSTSDIPVELVAKLGITVVPSYVMFGTESYRDGVELSRAQFYEKLASAKELPSTAAPPPAVYEQVYRRLAEESMEMVSIHLASKYSGIYNSAQVAARELAAARIAVIDSEQVTMGYGWLVVAAAEAAQRGASLEEIVALVEEMKPRSRVLAALGTLEYLYRGGRVSWVRAMVGTLLRIRPIIEVHMGEINLVERTRTMRRALEHLLALVQDLGPLQRAIVLHVNAAELASAFADELQRLHPEWARLIEQAGVTIASHAGPGAVGVACVTAP